MAKNRKSIKIRAILNASTACCLVSMVMGSSVWAEASPPQLAKGDQIEEIIVHARLRKENLQEIPVSVTAFTAQKITDAKIESSTDFVAMATGLSIGKVMNAGTTSLTIRGLTQQQDEEAPVAIVVDGVQQISDRQFAQELFDVQSVEVLRGPMGALYGRNASGGAILITSTQPSNETSGYVKLGYGTGDEYLMEGAVGGAIVKDKLMIRVAGRYRDRKGYWDNITVHQKADPYKDKSGRVLVKWLPDEDTEINFRVGLSQTDGGALLFGFQPTVFGPDGRHLAPGFPFDFSPSRQNADQVVTTFVSNNLGMDSRTMDDVSLRIQRNLHFATLNSVTSWVHVKEGMTGDLYPYSANLTADYGFGYVDSTQAQFLNVHAYSQELRLTSPSDQRVRWMFGGFFLHTDRFISTTLGIDKGLGIKKVSYMPDFNDPENPTYNFYGDDNHNTAFGFFGNTDISISDPLELSLALRYDKDIRHEYVSPYTAPFGDPGGYHALAFHRLQPKVTLRYKVAPEINVYASAGTGFRSGQFNQAGVGAAAASVGVVGLKDSVGQEDTNTYEIGFKSELFDRHVRLNGALYHSDIKNAQNWQYVGAVGALVLIPIQKVKVDGGELEIQANLFPGFDISGGISYSKATVKEYDLNPTAVGNWAPYVPRVTGNFSAQYRRDLTPAVGLFMRGEYELHGKQYWEPENLSPRSAYALVNLRLGLEGTNGSWSFTGSVHNLTNRLYNPRYSYQFNAAPAQPRVYSVEAKYNF